MKRLLLIWILLGSILMSAITYAYDWQSQNATVIDQKEEGLKTILTLKDNQDRLFTVTFQEESAMASLADKIIKYKNEFTSWQQIHFKEVSFVVSPGLLEVIIVPQELNHNHVNVVSAIPAGITMTYNTDKEVLRYDFRIMKDNLFIRIAGDYIQEDEMVAKLFFAYDNPLAYMRRTDPEYLSKQIDDLREETERLRQALIYLHNEDWLNHFRTIPPETIQSVVAIKQAHPGTTKAELWKEIKKQKIKITKQEFDLLMIVYYNEF